MKDRRADLPDEPRHLDRKPARDDARVAAGATAGDSEGPADPTLVDLSGLSIAGITRRRVGWIAAGFVSVWILLVFARQVGDATAAASRAVDMVQTNAALAAEVASLQNELELIVRPEYVAQQARAYKLGADREIPFTLAPTSASALDGAPGSAAVRLGARDERQTPLDSWLSLLFGAGGG